MAEVPSSPKRDGAASPEVSAAATPYPTEPKLSKSYWKHPNLSKPWLDSIYADLQKRTSFQADEKELQALKNILESSETSLDCIVSVEIDPEDEAAYLDLILLSRVDAAEPQMKIVLTVPLLGLPEAQSILFWTSLSQIFRRAARRESATLICAGFKQILRYILQASTFSHDSASLVNLMLGCEAIAVADVLVAAWMLESDVSPSLEDMDEFLPEWRAGEKQAAQSPTPTKKSSRKAIVARKSGFEKMQDLLDIYIVASELLSEKLLLSTENDLEKPFWEQEAKIPFLLGLMEFFGIGFDAGTLKSYEKTLKTRLNELQTKADVACGFGVEISSPKKLQDVLYKKLKLKPETQKSASLSGGGMSTSESVLKSMSAQHALPALVIEYRQVQKVLSSFVEPLQNFVDAHGRISTNWQQLGISTGRLSSNSPNLQALPRGDSLVNVRAAFKPSTPGWILIGADYSQLEMRLLAHFARDQSLINFFSSGKDIHGSVAAHWLKKDITEVTKQERDNAKRLVYGIMYGIGPRSLADMLGISAEEAKSFISTFLSSYPETNAFIRATQKSSRLAGGIRTISGRLRRLLVSPLDDDDESSASAQARADRQSVNSMIQGTGADIAKIAMIRIHRALVERNLCSSAHLLLQIHDELIYEAECNKAFEVLNIIINEMEAAAELLVPLKATPKAGFLWGSMKELKTLDKSEFDSVINAPPAASPAPQPVQTKELVMFEAWNAMNPSNKLSIDELETASSQERLSGCEERLNFIESFLRTLKKRHSFSPFFLHCLAASGRLCAVLQSQPFPYGDEEIEYAVTKIGGSADMPAVWIDRLLTEEGGRIPLSLLQLNLATIPRCKDLNFLPENGMMYLFYSADTQRPEIRFWPGGVVPDVDIVRLGPSYGFEHQGEPLMPLQPQEVEIQLRIHFSSGALDLLQSNHSEEFEEFKKVASNIISLDGDSLVRVGGELPEGRLALLAGTFHVELGEISTSIEYQESIFQIVTE